MAITSPRVIFACTIPTIVVILSYIWFKKKKQLSSSSEKPPDGPLVSCSSSGGGLCSSSDRSDVDIDVTVNEDLVVVVEQQQLEPKHDVSEADVTIESQLELKLEQENEEQDESGSLSSDIAVTETDTVTETCPESTEDVVEEKEQKEEEEEEVKEDKEVKEEEEKERQVLAEILGNMVSDSVTKNRRRKGNRSARAASSDAGSPNGNAESSTCPVTAVQTKVEEEKKMEDVVAVSELIERIEETHIENGDVTVEVSEEGISSSSSSPESNETVVEVTLTSDEDGDKVAVVVDDESTPNGRLSPPSMTDMADSESATVVTVEHPAAVSSPGSVDEPENHKATNGTDTSAYGSASHSPADELLESPTVSNYSDMHSEGSSDSGKGGSGGGGANGFPLTPMSVFEFELPQELCGRLIGQKGRYVNFIKSKSRANISIKRHPFNSDLKLCAVIGTEEDINAALVVIRKRFPLSRFPCISMVQVNAPLLSNVPIPDTLQLHLPEGVTCDVILSSLVNAGHFFVQQPTHPTYPSLGRLDQCMLHCYLNGIGAPELPKPVEAGVICAASTMGGWYRAQIVYVHPDTDECEVRFVDYGGYSQEAISSLRQIRSDFMTLPFQASECYLANVVPVDETQGWTLEATSLFEELAQGQILLAQIVTYSDDGIPYVHLYRVQGVMTTFINKELVACGFAKWVEHQA